MKCPRCHGTGKMIEWVATDTVSEYEFPCRKCNGTGEITLTNEEWFCHLSTEEKAEFIVKIEMSAMHPVKRGAVDMEKFIEEVVEWLKQPHKEKHE